MAAVHLASAVGGDFFLGFISPSVWEARCSNFEARFGPDRKKSRLKKEVAIVIFKKTIHSAS
jgi:hypothetical protein